MQDLGSGSSCRGNEPVRLSAHCDELKQSWCETAFSEMPDHALKRYFNFQLESIRDILDTSPFPEPAEKERKVTDELIGLINYLFRYFKNFIDTDVFSPTAYRYYKLASLDGIVHELLAKLKHAAIDEGLRSILVSYVNEMIRPDPDIRDTYHSLNYFEHFIKEVSRLNLCIKSAQELLIVRLTSLNFNHFAFLFYRKNKIGTAIAHLDKCAAMHLLESEQAALIQRGQHAMVYDKEWPGIAEMLAGYITGEIQKINTLPSALTAGQTIDEPKVCLGLSVAHLALFVRLFFEENFLPKNTLTCIFKFIARHYSTKKQPNISAASLSKEYYSVNQVTAAVVRDILQKMIARINRTFFPVLAAVTLAAHYYSGIR